MSQTDSGRPRPERWDPSRPRARRWVRLVGFLLLLALACASIWWIDRGVMRRHVKTPDAPAAGMPQ